jgi:hypothetical protein
MTDIRNWQATGVTHERECGCVLGQYTEGGTRDYHETWAPVVCCQRHDPGLPSAASHEGLSALPGARP